MSETVGSSDEQRGKRNLGELIPQALAAATASWVSAIVISPIPIDGAPFSVRARHIALQLGTPMMGFLVLGTVLACLYVPSNGSSPGSLRTRRGRGGNRRVRQRLRHRRRAVDGLEDRDRRSYSRRRPERFTERFLFRRWPPGRRANLRDLVLPCGGRAVIARARPRGTAFASAQHRWRQQRDHPDVTRPIDGVTATFVLQPRADAMSRLPIANCCLELLDGRRCAGIEEVPKPDGNRRELRWIARYGVARKLIAVIAQK